MYETINVLAIETQCVRILDHMFAFGESLLPNLANRVSIFPPERRKNIVNDARDDSSHRWHLEEEDAMVDLPQCFLMMVLSITAPGLIGWIVHRLTAMYCQRINDTSLVFCTVQALLVASTSEGINIRLRSRAL
ncbi:hypothetical protein EI94DRAFT_1708315 [Lactarius quietus]|nr:hypothetical protein EI94DRAFT_1708315 [Lactarius quietus]